MMAKHVKERGRLVRTRLAEGDVVGADLSETTLWFDVLTAIAEGRCLDPRACAREALAARKGG